MADDDGASNAAAELVEGDSRPMRNMKRMTPMSARSFSAERAGAKRAWNADGQTWPGIVGPSRMPPAISPTTAGCRSRRAIQLSAPPL
jgi:hypothetical protein